MNSGGGTSISSLRAQADAREQEEKRQQERKKAALVLMLRHLMDNGYLETLDTLEKESGVTLQKYDTADNIDMLLVIQEYEEYYQYKFSRKPKMFRRIAEAEGGGSSGSGSAGRRKMSGAQQAAAQAVASTHFPKLLAGGSGGSGASGSRSHSSSGGSNSDRSNASSSSSSASASASPSMGSIGSDKKGSSKPGSSSNSSVNGDHDSNSPPGSANNADDDIAALDGLSGTKIGSGKGNPSGLPPKRAPSSDAIRKGGIHARSAVAVQAAEAAKGGHDGDNADEDFFQQRILKPLPDFGFNSELRDLAAIIQRDIIVENPNVHWEDIAGAEKAQQLLKEAVVMPVKYPQFFQGILRPWKGILLFGPPGTGKTMLAKAVATECKTTFFNISASSIVSKWRGDSEKLVRVLFDLARHYRPSTIFLDEIDAIMGQRESSGGNEHEGSRRMKTELLIQMDGLARSTDLVFVLAASNLPWDLDQAMLRRLEKRILVTLPTKAAREKMFRTNLPAEITAPLDYPILAERTEGYSGSDITLVCKESAMRPLRRMMAKLEDPHFEKANADRIANHTLNLEPISQIDVEAALAATRPSASLHSERYSKWEQDFGSGIQM